MLERFLCIQRDERKNVLFFCLLGFTWSVSIYFGVAYSDAILIERVGAEALPKAYVITALGFLALSGIFISLYNRYAISRVYHIWTVIGSVFYLTIFGALFLGVESTPFLIFFKAFSYIIQIGFYTCFWTFIDQYFEMQNAKRLFGIFYSAIFLGAAVSGLGMSIASSLSDSKWFIMAMTTLPLLSSTWLSHYIHTTFEKLPDDFEQFVVLKTRARDLVKSILTSPFTILLLVFCIILQVLLVITEYEYMFDLQRHFMPKGGVGITDYLGKLYLWGGVFNILFGIFFYGRVIKKAGLNNALLLVPLFFTMLFFGWSFSQHMMWTVMGFVAVEGVLLLVEDNNFTLLLNAVPQKLKSKIRIISESLIEPFGILMSSGLIVLFKAQGRALGLSLSIIMLAVGLLMRAYYTKGIFYNLVSHVISFQRPQHLWETKIAPKAYKKSKQKFINEFSTLKDKERLFVFECGLRFNDYPFLCSLMEKVSGLSSELKLKVVEILSQFPKECSEKLQEYFEEWIEQDPRLSKHLVFHMAKMGMIGIDQIQLTTCPYMRASYALLLDQANQPSETENIFSKMLHSKSFLDKKLAIEATGFLQNANYSESLLELLDTSQAHREYLLQALSLVINTNYSKAMPTLLKQLENEHHTPFRYLLVDCIEKTLTEDNLEPVLIQTNRWTDPEKRDLTEAILQLDSEADSVLVDVLKSTKYNDKVRLYAGQVLAKKNKKQLQLAFNQIAQDEIHRAYLYYYHFITIQKSYPYSNLELLKKALKHSYDSIVDFLIQLQAQLHSFQKGDVLIQCLHSNKPKTASHALETVQKICSSKLYKKVQPLLENGYEKQFFKNYHQLKLPLFSLDDLLDHLENTPSTVNQMIVFSIKNRLNVALTASENMPKTPSYASEVPL